MLGVGAASGSGGELAVAAGVGCKDDGVDGLGVGVRMTREELDRGQEDHPFVLGINYFLVGSNSSDTVIGGSS